MADGDLEAMHQQSRKTALEHFDRTKKIGAGPDITPHHRDTLSDQIQVRLDLL
jgi:hypothetical protein